MSVTIVIAAAGVLMMGGLAGLAWQVRVQQRSVDRVAERLGQLLTGISILTDTTEGGLQDLARELERRAAEPGKPPRAVAARRISVAARRGRSVPDIAAAEQVSEGEIRLQLALAGKAPRARKPGASAPKATSAARSTGTRTRGEQPHADLR